LNRPYGKICHKGRVRKTAPKLYQTLDRDFYGIGLLHPGVECFIAQITKLLTHLGCRLSLGLEMLVLFELLVIELGIITQPFQSLYVKYNTWVTHSWLKLIWEKLDKFEVTIEVNTLPLQPPRE
jgi:hypothetical protein